MGQGSRRADGSVLVIDSGVGGLSVCEALMRRMPTQGVVYFADDQGFPYGLMEEEVLTARLIRIVDCMLHRHAPDLVVLACNTVSTLVLPILRERFSVPFVGVVPAIKPAALQSRKKHIGLLATPATVTRPYIDSLIHDYASDCKVTRVGSNELVLLAEQAMKGGRVSDGDILSIVDPFIVSGIDVLVLGCTHFPLLRDQLSSALPGVTLIDSGEAIANRVATLLSETKPEGHKTSASGPVTSIHRIYFSGKPPTGQALESFRAGLERLGMTDAELESVAIADDHSV